MRYVSRSSLLGCVFFEMDGKVIGQGITPDSPASLVDGQGVNLK